MMLHVFKTDELVLKGALKPRIPDMKANVENQNNPAHPLKRIHPIARIAVGGGVKLGRVADINAERGVEKNRNTDAGNFDKIQKWQARQKLYVVVVKFFSEHGEGIADHVFGDKKTDGNRAERGMNAAEIKKIREVFFQEGKIKTHGSGGRPLRF